MNTDPKIRWEQANQYAILYDTALDAWHAGHVNAVVILPPGSEDAGALLTGADTGGVWLIQQPGSNVSPASRCLTDDWDTPDIQCLALGPNGPGHVYAAGGNSLLKETDVSQGFPLENWRDVSAPNSDTIWALAVLTSKRKIIMAAQNGVFWANIPAPGGNYNWNQIAQPDFPPGPYSGAAVGPNDSVVVAAWGSDSHTHRYGIFKGDWSTGSLVMARAQIQGVDPSKMMRVSLASCPTDPRVIFALAGGSDDSMLAVLSYDSQQDIWNTLNPTIAGSSGATTVQSVAGNQQGYNNCIAVSVKSNILALGFRNGIFVSQDQGLTWVKYSHDSITHLHSDYHAVYFDPSDASGRTLYVGSDGGVAMTPDLGGTFSSIYNRQLLNLQFYGIGLSPTEDGLVAGGTQDNGNIYCISGAAERPFSVLDEGDGGVTRFISTGHILRNWNTEARVISAPWYPFQFGNSTMVPLTTPGNVSMGNPSQKIWNGGAWVPNSSDAVDLKQLGDSLFVPGSRGNGMLDVYLRSPYGPWNTQHLFWDGQEWSGPDPNDVSKDWENLAGVAISSPEPLFVSPTRIEVFVRATDRQLYHKFWDGTKWKDWEGLGGFLTSAARAVSWSAQRMDVFARGPDAALYHKWWDGNNWFPGTTDWESLGGFLTSAPEAVCWGVNRIDVFVRGGDNALYHKYFDGTNWQPSQTGYESLGGLCTSVPSVASWAASRLDVFVRGNDLALYHKAFDGANWLPSKLTYDRLGGALSSAPSAVSWGLNRLDIFVRGLDHGLYHKAWDGSNWKPNTLGYDNLGSSVITSRPKAASSKANRLDVFFLRQNGVTFPILWSIPWPVFRNSSNLLLYAIGAVDADVYGLFGDDQGENLQWQSLGSINPDPVAELLANSYITAIGSFDGTKILIGTDSGSMLQMSAPQFTAVPMTSSTTPPGGITAFAVQSLSVAYAISNNTILRYGGVSWNTLASAPWEETYSAIEVDPSLGTIFATTDSHVYSSHDDGNTWLDASSGLPVRGHFNSLRYVRQTNGFHFVYLGTYGRSIYRTYLNPVKHPKDEGKEVFDKVPEKDTFDGKSAFKDTHDGMPLVASPGQLGRPSWTASLGPHPESESEELGSPFITKQERPRVGRKKTQNRPKRRKGRKK